MARFVQRKAGNGTTMLVVLTVIWGLSWPLMKIALYEIPPLSMRFSTAGLGALTLLAFTLLQGRNTRLANRTAWAHVAVAAALNIVAFSLLTAFAQVSAATSRVAVLVYTMPIWAALLARPVLGERLTAARAVALVLCVAGLAALVAPQVTHGNPAGLLLAMAAGFCWAAGTIYLKWARIGGDPLAITMWQGVLGFVAIAASLLAFDGLPQLWPAHWSAIAAIAYAGVIGCGFAYVIWFDLVGRLAATTAALGVLSVPAIGVASSALILGERPSLFDMIGFALIFAASACVLIPTRKEVAVEPA